MKTILDFYTPFLSRLSYSLHADGNISRNTSILYGAPYRPVFQHWMHGHVPHGAPVERNRNRSGGGECLLRVLLLGDYIVSHPHDLLLLLQKGSLGGL